MKKLLLTLLLVNLVSCSLFKKEPQVENFLKGVSLLKNGKLNEAKPYLIQSCKNKKTAACAALGKDINESELSPLAVLQGASVDSFTYLNIVAPKAKDIMVLVWDQNKIVKQLKVAETDRRYSDWKTVKIKVGGLNPKTTYRLDVIDKTKAQLLDQRTFRTLKTSGKKLNSLVVSCLSDDFEKDQKQMWTEAMAQTKPEVIFIIGDAVYADWVNKMPVREGSNPQQLWLRYRQSWNMYELFKMKHLTPVYGVWDDHDYGKNNGGVDYQYKNDAKETFLSFFAQDNTPELVNQTEGHGVGFAIKLRNQMFYFLDNRYFRASAKEPMGTHLGEKQEKWLIENLKKHDLPSYLIMGDQFFGAYHPFESYEGLHKDSFDKFLKKIKETKRKVVFVSGDRHLTEIMKIEKEHLGYNTYELTSSGMYTKVYPGSFEKTPNKRGIAGADGKLNYMWVKSNVSKSFKLNVKSYTKGKKLLFSKRLKVK